ncbi:hypothetical protein [Deinococcus fonticola]|uniref:hypothetical protein n=1 Tax=Deinococcus fonticola TaxID=2528713 RepID=UPI00107531CA|nr:hypothetical protein [Deinococcus fonticola]
MTDDLAQQAQLEIDEYREQLVPAGLVERQMHRLALELLELAPAGRGESGAILLRAVAYLNRVAQWADVDPRLRLDCACTLCWTKREEILDALPPELRESLNGDWASADDLLETWETHRHLMDARLLARLLTWWAVANLVSNAAHLAEGEAAATLQPLLHAIMDAPQGLSGLN